MRPHSLLVLAAALAAAACERGGAGDKTAEARPAEARPAEPAPADRLKAFTEKALADVNAARPEGAAVEFEARVVDQERIVAAVPKGWEAGFLPGSHKPPADAGLGFKTEYSVGHTCDGMCQPKDWAASAEKTRFAQFRDAERFEVVEEQPLTGPTGKLLVAKARSGGALYINAARWEDGAENFYTCSATLDGEAAQALAPAFKAACANNRPTFQR